MEDLARYDGYGLFWNQCYSKSTLNNIQGNLERANLKCSMSIKITLGGGAYTLGRQNSGNCWHLFTIDNYTEGLKIPDQTLEVSLCMKNI